MDNTEKEIKVIRKLKRLIECYEKQGLTSLSAEEQMELTLAIMACGEAIATPEILKKIQKIKKTVADFYGVNISDLEGRSRKLEIVIPRHIAIYLCRESGYKLVTIGKAFNRCHRTIIYSTDVVRDFIALNAIIKGNKIKNEIEILQKLI